MRPTLIPWQHFDLFIKFFVRRGIEDVVMLRWLQWPEMEVGW